MPTWENLSFLISPGVEEAVSSRCHKNQPACLIASANPEANLIKNLTNATRKLKSNPGRRPTYINSEVSAGNSILSDIKSTFTFYCQSRYWIFGIGNWIRRCISRRGGGRCKEGGYNTDSEKDQINIDRANTFVSICCRKYTRGMEVARALWNGIACALVPLLELFALTLLNAFAVFCGGQVQNVECKIGGFLSGKI